MESIWQTLNFQTNNLITQLRFSNSSKSSCNTEKIFRRGRKIFFPLTENIWNRCKQECVSPVTVFVDSHSRHSRHSRDTFLTYHILRYSDTLLHMMHPAPLFSRGNKKWLSIQRHFQMHFLDQRYLIQSILWIVHRC